MKHTSIGWRFILYHISTLQCAKYGGNLFFWSFPDFDFLGHWLLTIEWPVRLLLKNATWRWREHTCQWHGLSISLQNLAIGNCHHGAVEPWYELWSSHEFWSSDIRQKGRHKSPPCIRTDVLNNVTSIIMLPMFYAGTLANSRKWLLNFTLFLCFQFSFLQYLKSWNILESTLRFCQKMWCSSSRKSHTKQWRLENSQMR